MISAALLSYALLVGTAGVAMLKSGRWTERAPRLAVACWQALAASVLLALAAAGLGLALSLTHVSADLARLLDLCVGSLEHGYESPGLAIAAGGGLALFLVVATRTAWCAARAVHHERRDRKARIQIVDLLGRGDVVPGALVFDHATPYAFCIGGRRSRVVLTSSLLTVLDPAELAAVLAHEAAHLRQRHHAALLACHSLFDTLAPAFPGFRGAMTKVRLLVELSADDSARKSEGARPLRDALERLACGPSPAGTLAATGHAVEMRLRRLGRQHQPLDRRRFAAAVLGLAFAVTIPLALAALPIVAMTWKGLCLLA